MTETRMWPPRWSRLIERAFGAGTRLVFPLFFESKKNQVTLLRLARGTRTFDVVAKHFVWGSCEREFGLLQQAHAAGVAVPRPLSRFGNVCFLEHVQGLTMQRIAREMPQRLDVSALGRWLARLHRGCRDGQRTLLRGDCVLPNFLVTPTGEIVGIDFEEARLGEPLDEVAQMAVTILLSGKPPGGAFSPNLPGLRRLVDAYARECPCDLAPRDLAGRLEADLDSRTLFLPDRLEDVRACTRAVKERLHAADREGEP